MKKNYILFLAFLSLTFFMNAQSDIEYTFDANSFEGWTQGGSGGAFASTFTNNPNGELEINWTADASTKNIVMYGDAAVQTLNADDYKFMQLRISNTSSQINVLRIRGRVAGLNGFPTFIDVPVTTNAAGEFSTYNFEITSNAYAGTLDRLQVVFRKNDGSVITDSGTIEVDNILVSASNTLSVNQLEAFAFTMYPNPVKNKLNITSKEAITKLEVIDLLGRSVLTVNEVSDSVDISSLTNAMYLIRVTSENGISTKKFIKE
ncbi:MULTISPECIES: T9SS type A sorting domain-containing protein [unclassified Lacinutrix]